MDHKKFVKEYCVIHIICGVAAVLTAGYLFLAHKGMVLRLPCVFFELTRLYCPGCGGTRAVSALLHGHIWESLRRNPAIVLGILVVLYYEAGAVLTMVKKNGRYYYDRKGGLLYLYLAVIVIFAVVRDMLLVCYGIDWL